VGGLPPGLPPPSKRAVTVASLLQEGRYSGLLEAMEVWVGLLLLHLGWVRCEVCHLGERQSPIDIISADSRYQEFRPFTLHGHDSLSLKAGTLYAENTNGSTIKLKASSTHTKALLGGGPLNVDYEFVEMHFHWGDVDNEDAHGSEHSVDGVKYPLELHLVHRNIHDDTVAEAMEHENGMTVLGFKFKIVDDEKHPKNEGMDHLTSIVKTYLTEPNSKVTGKELESLDLDVNVMNFLPVLMDEYFHYHGSITTGTCDEAVNWMVFKNPLAVTTANLRALQTIHSTDGKVVKNNFRPTQKIHGRPIYYHGLDLIKMGQLKRGSNIGLRDLKTPSHEQFLLTLSNCPGSPRPAPMWDTEGERADTNLWKSKSCETSNSLSLQPGLMALLSLALLLLP